MFNHHHYFFQDEHFKNLTFFLEKNLEILNCTSSHSQICFNMMSMLQKDEPYLTCSFVWVPRHPSLPRLCKLHFENLRGNQNLQRPPRSPRSAPSFYRCENWEPRSHAGKWQSQLRNKKGYFCAAEVFVPNPDHLPLCDMALVKWTLLSASGQKTEARPPSSEIWPESLTKA